MEILQKTALKGIQEDSKLSDIYFSVENIHRVQKKIKKEIFIRTNGTFKLEADQDVDELIIAMRSVYFDYARFLEKKIIHQVKELNDKVIETIVPDMITAIKQEYSYLKEINEPLKPISRPINVNQGRQILPSLTTVWEN